jgi:D-alanyl-D-alanine carboxypeptidase/D-alanyl-D-alanine-endopeptidase (penicillin-binding protein 4)
MTKPRLPAALVFGVALWLGAGGALAAAPVPAAVAAALRGSGLPLASFGIDVRAVDGQADGDLVVVNAERPFLLASTTKLVTSLAALDLLGPEHRWRTGAVATGPVADGRLAATS